MDVPRTLFAAQKSRSKAGIDRTETISEGVAKKGSLRQWHLSQDLKVGKKSALVCLKDNQCS